MLGAITLLGILLAPWLVRLIAPGFGEIEVDAKGQTNVPGILAAGDCTTVPYKQIVIAMSEGAKAALAAFDHLVRASAPAG